MEYRRFGDTYILRLDRGEEILESLASFCAAEDVKLGSVGALGAADRTVTINFCKNHQCKRR